MLPTNIPSPDCEELRSVILRKTRGARVHFFEHSVDEPVMKAVAVDLLGLKWVDFVDDKKRYWDNVIQFHTLMGYDAFKMICVDFDDHKMRDAKKNSGTGSLTWHGLIESWADFERYNWPSPQQADFSSIDYINSRLPEGMGFFISTHQGPFALASNLFFGIENLSFFAVDQPDLLKAVFGKISDIKYKIMEQVIGLPNVMGIWSHDDMGHKTSTMVSPGFLREYTLGHHKRMAALAHKHGKLYLLHSCGNIYSLMDELIEDVKIDAKHSYEDIIMPVTEAYKKYGKRVGTIGGVDVDVICRATEAELIPYLRTILDACTQDGGYVFGTGNSVTSYTPVENYLTMMKTGWDYRM